MQIENEYKNLIRDILENGEDKGDRTGTGTKAVFGRIIRHDMSKGFPILTSKKIYFNHALTELLWILNGRTDMQYLRDHGVKYWEPDYRRSGRTDETLGPVYGKQWRDFFGVDQFKAVIKELKDNPNSRRLVVNAWNPAELDAMALPPCHYGFQLYANNGKLDLMWNQRSADVFLGLPYDIVMYGLLLELIAEGVGMVPGILSGSLGDCHLYINHLRQSRDFLVRDEHPLPRLKVAFGIDIVDGAGSFLRIPTHKMVELIDYKHEAPLAAPLSVG